MPDEQEVFACVSFASRSIMTEEYTARSAGGLDSGRRML